MGVFEKVYNEVGGESGSANLVQDRAGKLSAGSKIDIQTTAGGPSDGVIRDTLTSAGEAADLKYDGFPLVEFGGTVADGDDLMLDTAGKYVKAELGSIRVAKALEAGSAGSLGRVQLYRKAQERPRVRGANTASAAGAVAPPQGADYFHVTGTAAITGWTNPTGLQDGASFTVIPDGIFTWTAAGNIAVAGTAVVSRALTFTWDATTSKWYPSYV